MADMTSFEGYAGTQQKQPRFEAKREMEAIESRTLRRFLGFIFAIAAVGLWIAPGASWGADVLLMKTGLTAILCFCAIVALLPRL